MPAPPSVFMPSIVTYNDVQSVQLETSEMHIPADATGVDPVSLDDISILTYLSEDPKNIVFYSNQHYYPSNKDALTSMIIPNTSNTKYECSVVGSMESVIKTVPYLSMKSIGLDANYVVPLGEIKTLIELPELQSMELIAGRNLASVASLNVLNNNSTLSAARCQAGQNSMVANMRIIQSEGGNVGGNKRRAIRRRTRKTKKTKIKK